ncbi:ATP-binding protein [Orrella sp. JC864]|uniref:ATP-binding protein n=1 Tax=Orrella sp. JC864 TaxID=3120298 RepID=UPI003007FBA1
MTDRAEPCEHEPIRVPGSIQPHGFLVAVDIGSQRISRISANAGQYLGRAPRSLLGRDWREAIEPLPAGVQARLAQGPHLQEPVFHAVQVYNGHSCSVSSHAAGDEFVLEFEALEPGAQASLDALYPQIRASVELIRAQERVETLHGLTARLMREMTGFDRVLVYRFDAAWNGTVVGESRNERLPSYLDLRFPAADIPAQARELYRLNRIRLIPDVDYEPVPLLAHNPQAQPLDLSYSVLRSVSPMHLQYMRNMRTPASMSFSLLVDGQLWGLVSCHHSEPRRVPTQVRAACDFLAQIVAMQLAGKHRAADAAERVSLQALQTELLSSMAQARHFADGLARRPEAFLGLTQAVGAAVVLEDECLRIGQAPPAGRILQLAGWLAAEQAGQEVFATDRLPALWPDGAGLSAQASGVLAISVSQLHRSYVLWFRPELVQTVSWGGDPRKAAEPDERLHPRKSFEVWKETLRHRSEPWTPAQVDAAASLRNAILGIVMRKAEELAELSNELRRSNKELEAFSYSVSHDLRAPFRHIVGYAELLKEVEVLRDQPRALRYVDTIIESAHTAGRLVDGLLDFSQAGRVALARDRVNMDRTVRECLQMLEPDTRGRDITWHIDPLGTVVGDAGMLRQVFQNLLGNAIKYTRGREHAIIRVRREKQGANAVFSVSDNGVGFDMRYVGKLFGVFQRLHRMEEFEGTGIGLANVKRIAERHGGKVWAEGEPDKGATFFFSIPDRNETVP